MAMTDIAAAASFFEHYVNSTIGMNTHHFNDHYDVVVVLVSTTLLPFVVSILCLLPGVYLFEFLVRQPWCKKYYIEYDKGMRSFHGDSSSHRIDSKHPSRSGDISLDHIELLGTRSDEDSKQAASHDEGEEEISTLLNLAAAAAAPIAAADGGGDIGSESTTTTTISTTPSGSSTMKTLRPRWKDPTNITYKTVSHDDLEHNFLWTAIVGSFLVSCAHFILPLRKSLIIIMYDHAEKEGETNKNDDDDGINNSTVIMLTIITMMISYGFQFLCQYYLIDFFTYVIHYGMHTSDFLWKHLHRTHHQETTPTAMIAFHCELLDAIISGGIPHILATYIVQPHPIPFYCALFLTLIHVSAYAHSGIQIDFVDIVLGKYWIPFKATSRLHDYHHKCSGKRPTNLGITTWIWDWFFGTLTAVQV